MRFVQDFEPLCVRRTESERDSKWSPRGKDPQAGLCAGFIEMHFFRSKHGFYFTKQGSHRGTKTSLNSVDPSSNIDLVKTDLAAGVEGFQASARQTFGGAI